MLCELCFKKKAKYYFEDDKDLRDCCEQCRTILEAEYEDMGKCIEFEELF